jgi:hypothetical protein
MEAATPAQKKIALSCRERIEEMSGGGRRKKGKKVNFVSHCEKGEEKRSGSNTAGHDRKGGQQRI